MMILLRKSCRCRQALKEEKGFTLTEVLVAMVIFSITTLGLTLILVTMIGSNDYANQLTQGIQLAEDKLEELKNECCLVVEPGTDTFDEFTRTWSFADNDPVDGLLKVTVTVSWLHGQEEDHSIYLSALMLPS